MKTLAFDLSTTRGSMVICEDDQVLAATEWENDRRVSAPFFRALSEAIRTHGSPKAIVVGLGPGSYTGTRIAISAAVGLQIATGAELTGLPSVTALSSEQRYAVVGDAKRQSFFFVRIDNNSMLSSPELLSRGELAQRIAEIEYPVYTSDQLPQFNAPKLKFPCVELLCRVAARGTDVIRAPLAPIYLREPHITLPVNTNRT